MNPEKTYGGKAGVWLTKKRKLSSTSRTSTSKLKAPLLSSSISSESSSAAVTKDSKTQKPSNEQRLLSRVTNLIKKPRAELFLLKASRHLASIPKKYLIRQRKRPLLHSSNYNQSNKRQRQNGRNEDTSSRNNPSTYGRGGVRLSTATTSPSFQNHNHRITQSPNVRLLGWDSMKCRPIYNCTTFQNNGDGDDDDDDDDDDGSSNFTTLQESNIDIHNLDSFPSPHDNNEDDNNDIGNNNDEIENDDEVEISDDESEDPNEMWKKILSQMNEKSRKAKITKNRQTYGGLKAKRSKASIHTNRNGLSNMPQSVLERLVSPKQSRKQLNNQCKKQKVAIPSKRRNKIRRKIRVSPNIGTPSRNIRLHGGNNAKLNTTNTGSFSKQEKQKTARKSLNFISNNDFLPRVGVGASSPVSASNSIASYPRKVLLLTPRVDEGKGGNVCLAPHSDLSKDISISSGLRVPASQQSQKGNVDVMKSLSSSPPSALRLPEHLDYNEKENASPSSPKSVTKNDRENMGGNGNKKQSSGRRQKNAKSSNKKATKAKDKTQNVSREKIENHDGAGCQVNQITSSTSLAVAKAFFERLDRYQLSIA